MTHFFKIIYNLLYKTKDIKCRSNLKGTCKKEVFNIFDLKARETERKEKQSQEKDSVFKEESQIDFLTQCLIMTIWKWEKL